VALRIAGLDILAPGSARKLIAIERLAVAAGEHLPDPAGLEQRGHS
jgi:hypothetical protein